MSIQTALMSAIVSLGSLEGLRFHPHLSCLTGQAFLPDQRIPGAAAPAHHAALSQAIARCRRWTLLLLPAGLADAVERVAPSVLGVRARRIGTSSALCWRPGVLVTAVSAVGQADRVQVIASGGEALMGTVRGIDPATDVAVVAAEGNWPSAERRLDPAARVGDFVFAVGRDASGMVHASFGHVGAVAGAWRSWRGGQLDRYIRLDGGLYPGLVGAPVCDVQGK